MDSPLCWLCQMQFVKMQYFNTPYLLFVIRFGQHQLNKQEVYHDTPKLHPTHYRQVAGAVLNLCIVVQLTPWFDSANWIAAFWKSLSETLVGCLINKLCKCSIGRILQTYIFFFQSSLRKEFPQSIGGSDICCFCKKRVYVMERLSAEGHFFHRECFRCAVCATTLRLAMYAFDAEEGNEE